MHTLQSCRPAPLTSAEMGTLSRMCGDDPDRAASLARASRTPRTPVALRIFSDLHQDMAVNAWNPWERLPLEEMPSDANGEPTRRNAGDAPRAEIVVVAGDVHEPGLAALEWLALHFAGFHVVYVVGNHDLWCGEGDRFTYLEMLHRMRQAARRLGIHLLVDSQVVVAGVRLMGGTLWTDLRLGTSSRSEGYATARRGMNDYRRIRRKPSGDHRHLRPEETVAMHRATVAYLDAALAVPHDGPMVVVTHQAPSPRSLSDPYMDLRHCYASNLEGLIERHAPDLWVHGHLHTHSDYRIGRTRVVANPRGHEDELATSGFVQDMLVHV